MFNFLSGLQPWVQLELRRQKVLDLSSAIATANGPVVFDVVASKGDNGASEISFKIKEKDEMVRKKKFGAGNRRSEEKAKEKGSKPNVCCFIYEGNHFTRECSKRA